MQVLIWLFSWLSEMLKMNPAIVLSVSFLWGVLSVLLSPCHLSGIPLAIGYINGKGKMKHSKALVLSVFFALGILLSLLILGIITSLIGRMLGDVGKITTIVIGIIFIIVGFLFFDFIKLPQIPVVKAKLRPGSFLGALVMGLVFGAALGPCTFGFMMPILGVAFKAAAANLIYAFLIILSYGIGHSIIIIFAGTFMNWVQNLLNWEEKSKGIIWFRRICGVLIIFLGAYLIFNN